MTSTIPVPEYKFTDGASETKVVTKVAKVDTYLVQYTDGEGKIQVRLAFRFPKSKTTFVLQQQIDRTPVMTPAHEWFNKELVDMLRVEGLEPSPDSGEGAEGDADSI